MVTASVCYDLFVFLFFLIIALCLNCLLSFYCLLSFVLFITFLPRGSTHTYNANTCCYLLLLFLYNTTTTNNSSISSVIIINNCNWKAIGCVCVHVYACMCVFVFVFAPLASLRMVSWSKNGQMVDFLSLTLNQAI